MIAGLLLVGPASAAKVIDKHTQTVYSSTFGYGTLSFTTYKINSKYIKVMLNIRYKNGKSGKMTLDFKKISSKKIKVIGTYRTAWGNGKYTYIEKTRWSVSKYYTNDARYELRDLSS
ncbi:hypothetical protein [Methanobacterium congolense]|uniref:hypothetical protein n=1 Tax=Methanobacterium congolense TaxID=118062 RepID=UPI0011AE87C2|nr:hypothetical protein [Methanobacterium congolense]